MWVHVRDGRSGKFGSGTRLAGVETATEKCVCACVCVCVCVGGGGGGGGGAISHVRMIQGDGC